MSRYELIEPIQQMRKQEQMIRLNLSKDKPYQASGAIAVMVDTGFVGVFLYLLNLLLGFSAILKSQNKSRYVVSIVYLIVIPWSFVGTVTPVLLFYFWIMPKNPIILMLEKKEKKF
jgi:cytochrome c biogenesis protein CcdA